MHLYYLTCIWVSCIFMWSMPLNDALKHFRSFQITFIVQGKISLSYLCFEQPLYSLNPPQNLIWFSFLTENQFECRYPYLSSNVMFWNLSLSLHSCFVKSFEFALVLHRNQPLSLCPFFHRNIIARSWSILKFFRLFLSAITHA